MVGGLYVMCGFPKTVHGVYLKEHCLCAFKASAFQVVAEREDWYFSRFYLHEKSKKREKYIK
jgi:hypothetical protein